MSHHSKDFDEEIFLENPTRKSIIEKFFNDEIGPTKLFPHGKLTKSDEGEIAFAVGIKDNRVVIDFNSPVHWIGMTKDQAISLGELLIKISKGD